MRRSVPKRQSRTFEPDRAAASRLDLSSAFASTANLTKEPRSDASCGES
jgi:hypothetical protein